MDRQKLITSKEYWIEQLENRAYNGMSIYQFAETIANTMKEAINYSQCCTELPDQMVIKSSVGKLMMLNCNDLLKMELKKKVIEGFETWTVIGTGAVL